MGQIDKEKEGKRGGEEVRCGSGGLRALPPGVLSRCQEADRFRLCGHESACSVLCCQGSCLSIYLQRTSIQNMHECSPFRAGGQFNKVPALNDMLAVNIIQIYATKWI